MTRIFHILLIFAGFHLAACRGVAQQVIANLSVKANAISAAELRDVFTGVTANLKDGSRVVPATQRGGPVHVEFLKQYVGKSDPAFRATWRSLLFSGEAAMPEILDGDDEMVEYVARTRGAVGYVSDAAKTSGVKVLTVR